MAKDPAFLFYPADWNGGTIGMTFEEKGAYIELLMMQFNRGHMTSHMVGQVVGQLWGQIQDKFIQDEDGLWYNVRLEEEKNKRKAFTVSRKNNLLGTNKHTNNFSHMGSHMGTHMVNVNVNEDINTSLTEKNGKEKKQLFVNPKTQGQELYAKRFREHPDKKDKD
jgi:uncharacterized protein YdaU (DUF1376 family)